MARSSPSRLIEHAADSYDHHTTTMYYDNKSTTDGINKHGVDLVHEKSGGQTSRPYSDGAPPYSGTYPVVQSMLEPAQPLGIKNSTGTLPTEVPESPSAPTPFKIRRKPLKRVPVNHNHELQHQVDTGQQKLTPLPFTNSRQTGSTDSKLNYETLPSQPSGQLPSNHPQSTSKGSLTSNSISSSPAKSSSSLYTVPSNTTSNPPTTLPTYSSSKFQTPIRTPSPGRQMNFATSNPGYQYGHSPAGYSQHLQQVAGGQEAAHVKTMSDSSFNFNLEKSMGLSRSQQVEPAFHNGSNLTNYEQPLNGYPNNINTNPNNFNANHTPMSSNPHLTRVSTAPLMQQYHQAPNHQHRRNSSIHSTSSSQSQPPYMTAIPQGLMVAASNNSHTNSISSQKQFNAAQKRGSVAHSAATGPYIASSSQHKRLGSTSSRVSRGSSEFQHSNVSGSFYVHELRRRSATTWCDIPASVWGVPIGIAESTGFKVSSLSSRAISGQRRTMDIRHSHLTPRLLASEADDSDYDGASVNTAIEHMGSGSAAVSRTGSNSSGLRIPSGAAGGNFLPEGGLSDSASIRSTATLSSPKLPEANSLAPPPNAHDAKGLSRSLSVNSVKSIEEGTQKIRLFVANPDSDSD